MLTRIKKFQVMRKVKGSFSSVSQKRWLLVLVNLSIIVVVSNEVLFDEVPELFPKGDQIGQVFSNLCFAFLSSYIFYLVLVVPKERHDKRNIYERVYDLTNKLIGRADSVYYFILSGSRVEEVKYNRKTITFDEFKHLTSKVNPKDIVPSRLIDIGQEGTYAQFILLNAVDLVSIYIEEIFSYMPFLETDYVVLINRIKESSFFNNAPRTLSNEFVNKDFSNYSKEMFEYLQIIRQLEEYNEKYIKSRSR